MELFLNFLNEADTSATTFFHEVICGIACADPVGASKIKTGEDVKKYFDNGTIIAVNSRLQKLDVMSLKQARFLSSMSKPNAKLKTDAVNIAKQLRMPSRLGVPRGVVMWTGPTNDASDYGAADIAYNDKGISLKYGKGQLKNLTVGSFGKSVLGIKESILNVLLKDYKDNWNQMTADWLSLIVDAIPLEKGKVEFELLSNKINSWQDYQKARLTDEEQEFFDKKDNGYVRTHKKGRELRYLARKYYETLKI